MPAFFIDYFMLFVQILLNYMAMHGLMMDIPNGVVPAYMA